MLTEGLFTLSVSSSVRLEGVYMILHVLFTPSISCVARLDAKKWVSDPFQSVNTSVIADADSQSEQGTKPILSAIHAVHLRRQLRLTQVISYLSESTLMPLRTYIACISRYSTHI